ncbi:hypothetical protein EDD18DRAFT_1180680 [Armillaria luteobubalina]|uniref:Secreted protein n=1 Tax=Armillaria luteobubalina TaxID=153913 RepID=A0AA39PYU6_9AGAR|nr:hypothetical protein EDD18DRAFT_1180680 [Armillaria luteobubalina]
MTVCIFLAVALFPASMRVVEFRRTSLFLLRANITYWTCITEYSVFPLNKGVVDVSPPGCLSCFTKKGVHFPSRNESQDSKIKEGPS